MALPLHGQQTEQAFPRRGTTKNSTQATPGFLAAAFPSQLHLSPDPVALAASLPSPLGAEQSGSPVIPDTTRAEQFHSGLPGGFAAKPCRGLRADLGWRCWGHQALLAFGRAQGPVCLTSSNPRPRPRHSLLSTWTYPPPSRPHYCFNRVATAPLLCNLCFCRPLQLFFLGHQM